MSLHTQELRISFVLLIECYEILIECFEILNSRFALEHRYDESSDDYLDTRILSGCLLDYAQPVVNEIVGCPSEGCAREGGDTITIRGSNFGSSGALIFLNGVECINVTHVCSSSDTQSCHRNLRCVTRGLDTWQNQVNTMLVVQSNQFGKSDAFRFAKCTLISFFRNKRNS